MFRTTHFLLVPFLIGLLFSLSTAAKALDIRVNDSRENNFYLDALRWILDKSKVDYQLVHTTHPISTQKRKVALLLNDEIDVIYAGTTKSLESSLTPVRVPITRGLVGTRVLVINKKYQSLFTHMRSLTDLKAQVAALGYGWPETEIFSSANMRYIEKSYEDIFNVINTGGKYYFPRGILEPYAELQSKHPELPNLSIENTLLLKYKSAVFFFINPNNLALKNALEMGFKKGYADGSYQKFFYNHPVIKMSFSQANMDERTIIEIPNISFPDESKNIPKEFWH